MTTCCASWPRTTSKKSELAQHLDWFAVSGDGSRLVIVDEGELRAVPAGEQGDSDSTVWIDARRILHTVARPRSGGSRTTRPDG